MFKTVDKGTIITGIELNDHGYHINKCQRIPKEQSKWTIQRNWQHRIHKTKKNKTKTQHNICWTPLYGSKHK